MKQYRITSADIIKDSADDCYLAPNDPIHELKITSYLGGLGGAARLAEYKEQQPFNNYPVYPEDDGYDTPKNPYSPV